MSKRCSATSLVGFFCLKKAWEKKPTENVNVFLSNTAYRSLHANHANKIRLTGERLILKRLNAIIHGKFETMVFSIFSAIPFRFHKLRNLRLLHHNAISCDYSFFSAVELSDDGFLSGHRYRHFWASDKPVALTLCHLSWANRAVISLQLDRVIGSISSAFARSQNGWKI